MKKIEYSDCCFDELTNTTMATTMTITPTQVREHRELRKRSGMVGCITGRPEPEMDFFGYRDVQIWYRDASGRLNGDPGFNRMDPYCFCFDCRDSFDRDGTIDAELVNSGHQRAFFVYSSLLPVATCSSAASSEPISHPSDEPSSTATRTTEPTTTTSVGFSNESPQQTTTTSSHLAIRSNGGGIEAL